MGLALHDLQSVSSKLYACAMCQKGTRFVLKFREAGPVLLKEESHEDHVTNCHISIM